MVNLRLRRHEGDDGTNSSPESKSNADEKQRKQFCNLRNIQLLAFGLFACFISFFLFPSTAGTDTSAAAVASMARGSSSADDSLDKPHSNPSSSSSLSWTWESPHLLNCHEALAEDDNTPKDNGKFVTTKTTPPFLMNIHDPTKDSISKEIESSGCWECNHLNEVIRALSSHSNSYFLDIGANIGMWSLTAAAAGFPTISIEPFMQNYRRICKSILENGESFGDLVHVVNMVATSKPEDFRLAFLDNNFGGTHVVPVLKGEEEDKNEQTEGGGEGESEKEKGTIIKGYPIDSLQLPTDRPVVMKVDVEGHELQALKGAINFLTEANIVYAMMELRPDVKSNPDWKRIFEVLDSKGLKPYRINYEGMEDTKLDVNSLDEWKHFKHPNVRYYDVAWRKKQ
mmetsp:Transcript_19684/g.38959  ORF Transcript_19684/g.38959 Transcript_19684/m.38959 type:complete len:398 (+) Transcript_19684:81-1274(+)